MVAAARADAKGDVEAFLLEDGCLVCLLGYTEPLRHSDEAVGSLEYRCSREGCSKVLVVRLKPLIDASLIAMLIYDGFVAP